jgi:hypothetical protein
LFKNSDDVFVVLRKDKFVENVVFENVDESGKDIGLGGLDHVGVGLEEAEHLSVEILDRGILLGEERPELNNFGVFFGFLKVIKVNFSLR